MREQHLHNHPLLHFLSLQAMEAGVLAGDILLTPWCQGQICILGFVCSLSKRNATKAAVTFSHSVNQLLARFVHVDLFT